MCTCVVPALDASVAGERRLGRLREDWVVGARLARHAHAQHVHRGHGGLRREGRQKLNVTTTTLISKCL